MKLGLSRGKGQGGCLLLVEKPSGSKTGLSVSNNFWRQLLSHVVLLNGDPGSIMGKHYLSYRWGQWLIDLTSLHLTSHLFSEHLLDRDLYLSWIVRSLRDCDLDSLPIWLLVTKIYLQEVLQYRHHGRLLVEAIFDHLRRVIYPKAYIPYTFQHSNKPPGLAIIRSRTIRFRCSTDYPIREGYHAPRPWVLPPVWLLGRTRRGCQELLT